MTSKGKVLIKNGGKQSFMGYPEMDFLFKALGFYLGTKKGYWYEKVTYSPFVEYVPSEPKESSNMEAKGIIPKAYPVVRQRLVHADRIEYGFVRTKDIGSVKKARAIILHNHFTKRLVYCLSRSYKGIEWGNSIVRAQRIVCFDVDGRSNTNTQEVVRELVSRFPEVKFIEHNTRSHGYHIYIEFDRDVTDNALKRLEEDFKRRGFTIEAVSCKGHIRLPMGRQYGLYGLYSPKKKNLIQRATFEELLAYWKDYDKFAYFDPSFEMEEAPRYKKEFRGSYQRKKDAPGKLKQMMLENPKFDYGARERQNKITSILSSVIRYGLSLEDFREIGRAHDKGARGETDYKGYFEWGKKHFEHNGKEVAYKYDYDVLFDRVKRYSTTRTLSPEIDKLLSEKVETDLMAFLSSRRNVNRGGKFKNEQLMKQRWNDRIKAFVLFLIQHEEAIEEEYRRCFVAVFCQLSFPQPCQKGFPLFANS